jgi:hypothetical protein
LQTVEDGLESSNDSFTTTADIQNEPCSIEVIDNDFLSFKEVNK